MSEKPTSLINFPEVPPSVDNAVQNLTDKPSLSIGTTFSDLWDLVFGGISYLSEKKKIKYAHDLEEYRKKLEFSLEQIPPEKAIEPSIQTTAQALENSKYCIDQETLQEMFVALISNSMNSDYQKDIHPSFAEILKQMSHIDAEIIKTFINSSTVGLPICNYIVERNGGFTTLLEHVFLKYPQLSLPVCSLSISSLVRLGLLEATYEDYLLTDGIYAPFEKHLWFKKLQEEFSNEKVYIQKGRVWLTPLGRSFTKVCIPN